MGEGVRSFLNLKPWPLLREAHGEAEIATKIDIRELELKFGARMSENKAQLIRWIVGAGFLQSALIAALLLKLIR